MHITFYNRFSFGAHKYVTKTKVLKIWACKPCGETVVSARNYEVFPLAITLFWEKF